MFEPSQTLTYLGFIINSVEMNVTLTERKITKLTKSCTDILGKNMITIRELSELIGQMVASFPAVEHGRLFYRLIENEKSAALKQAKGEFDAQTCISDQARRDIQWWISNIPTSSCPISHGNPNFIMKTDASGTGWGGVKGQTKTGGHWNLEEQNYHINCLELLAVLFSLKALCSNEKSVHIQVKSDNTTTVSYINSMGGTKDSCYKITRDIWDWCIERDIWLSACHLPGVENTEADKESRLNHDNTEWQLNPKLFRAIEKVWATPKIDLFASRVNKQILPYVAWKPDPEAHAVDAFSITWNQYFYAFPPICLIGKALAKIQEDRATGILIAPL